MAIARVHEDVGTRRVGEQAREISPMGNRSEAFVKQHDGRTIRVALIDSGRFKFVPVDTVTVSVYDFDQWGTAADASDSRTGLSRRA